VEKENSFFIYKKMKKIILFFGILAGVILVIYIFAKNKPDEIIANKQFTVGQITDYQDLSKPSCYVLKYSYEVGGISYNNMSSSHRIAKNNYKYFSGKTFPVVYAKTNPERSYILITPYAFKEWGLIFPDSLKWVMQYEKY
jgi:hypothetical protein